MIFPAIRISQLSRDVEEKRAIFDRSIDGLKTAVRRKLSPLNLLRENPQWLIAPVMSIFSAGTLGKFLIGLVGHKFGHSTNGHAKNGNGSKKSKVGLIGGLLKFGGRTLFKTVTPVAFGAVRYALKSALRAYRKRKD